MSMKTRPTVPDEQRGADSQEQQMTVGVYDELVICDPVIYDLEVNEPHEFGREEDSPQEEWTLLAASDSAFWIT